jgi:hypothetical protein
MNNQDQVQALNDMNDDILETIRNYLTSFQNANVQASPALKIEVITELFEYILGSQNCRLLLLTPNLDRLFTTTEQKVAEFLDNPKAQENNRLIAACQALDVFFRNGRILKAEQAAQAPPPPPVAAPVAEIVIEVDENDEEVEVEEFVFEGVAYYREIDGQNMVFDRATNEPLGVFRNGIMHWLKHVIAM